MKILLNKKELLELEIIHLLLNQPTWTTMKEAAEKLSISESQFSTSYQNILQRPISQRLGLTLQRNKGIRINHKDIRLDSILFDYISNSLTFKILDNAFQKQLNIQQFCIENHISASLFYKHNAFLKDILKKNHLYINIRTMQIMGDEKYARAFFI
ncbi:helix-turn-helix domain-containing protein [Listeria cornellensis]|uniref:Mga helix-turn-helix domain-containing protein n=1 Tax=Listeria cornellensis FSL F6-0969 TaxID=1265820 RepID=W7BHE3_9LIST|nr:helix-turn-helix domain-containing protein [Listeria cornellensis]EUJ25277.1 hypothetical protein PCORN_18009 [Listeria cornellensis FSL F6-0969]